MYITSDSRTQDTLVSRPRDPSKALPCNLLPPAPDYLHPFDSDNTLGHESCPVFRHLFWWPLYHTHQLCRHYLICIFHCNTPWRFSPLRAPSLGPRGGVFLFVRGMVFPTGGHDCHGRIHETRRPARRAPPRMAEGRLFSIVKKQAYGASGLDADARETEERLGWSERAGQQQQQHWGPEGHAEKATRAQPCV